jgi:hypothetical protein
MLHAKHQHAEVQVLASNAIEKFLPPATQKQGNCKQQQGFFRHA